MSGRSGNQGGSGGESSGSDDYSWLYADSSKKTSADKATDADSDGANNPDATAVMPTMSRESSARPPAKSHTPVQPLPRSRQSSAAPARTAIAPTPAVRAGRGKKRSPVRWVGIVLALWLMFLIATPLYAWFNVSNVNINPGSGRPAAQPGTTYLVVGSDGRKGLAGQRTDTIMLLHTGDGPNLLLSIPRDSLVEVPGAGVTKVNAAFSLGGPKLLVQTVENNTGIRVDDYVEIGFTGFVSMVDAVGGIEICPKEAMNDPQAELDIKAGCQEADGATALGYARSRKTQSLGDIGRAQNQREVVSKIGAEVLSPATVLNPLRYWRVVNGGAQSVRVNKGMGFISAGQFARAMTKVDGQDGLTCGVPILNLDVTWDPERSEQMFEAVRTDSTSDIGKDLCTPDGFPRGS